MSESLDIHPFMLSKWRKQVRDGELAGKPVAIEPDAVAELRRLRGVEKQFKRLQMEHDLLKSHPVCLRTRSEVFAFSGELRQRAFEGRIRWLLTFQSTGGGRSETRVLHHTPERGHRSWFARSPMAAVRAWQGAHACRPSPALDP